MLENNTISYMASSTWHGRSSTWTHIFHRTWHDIAWSWHESKNMAWHDMTQHDTTISKQHDTQTHVKKHDTTLPSHAASQLFQWTGDREPKQDIRCSETSVGQDGPLLDCACRLLGRIWSPIGHVVDSMQPWEQKRMQGGNNTRGNNMRQLHWHVQKHTENSKKWK